MGKPKPVYQNPDANVDGGYRMAADEEIDYSIQWAAPVPKVNKEPASSREIIEMMNDIREQAITTKIDTPVYIVGRTEVIKEVAKQLEGRELGFCIIDHASDGPRFEHDKGIWESNIHIFPNEGSMLQWLHDE